MDNPESISPSGLHPQLVKRLLDRLEIDQDFRAAFEKSPEHALRSIGYTDPWACLQMKGGTLASPEQIKADRQKLEEGLATIHGYECPLSMQNAN